MIKKVIAFLIANFTALALGSFCTKAAVHSAWYINLNKAPWTPPGYMFGIAWSIIMICFAIYMATLVHKKAALKPLMLLYGLQWILNTSWNPIFFYYHQTILGLFVIVALTLLISFFLFKYRKISVYTSLFITPYFLWLLIATSLNAYIVFKN